MSLKDTVIEEGLICFDEERNFITYIHQNKKRNYNNPKDKVQAETFLTLVLNYGYPANRKQQFVSIQMGSETKESDIAFYSDDDCHETYILVECKKEDLTDQLLIIAVGQAYSYAVAEVAKCVWTTSRIKNKYYAVPDKKPKSEKEIPDIQQFVINKLAPYKYVKGGFSQIDTDPTETNIVSEPDLDVKQKYFELQVVSEIELTKIFIQSHQALWGGGHRNPSVAFDEFDKLIFCKKWDKEKANAIKTLEDEAKKKNPKANKKEIKEVIQVGNSPVQSPFTDNVNLVKEELTQKYFLAKQAILDDYPIFMAISEDNGYDSTGRNINNNELSEIGIELSKFIAYIIKTEK